MRNLKCLTQADQVKETFQDYLPIIHIDQTVWRNRAAWRPIKFPNTNFYPQERHFCEAQFKTLFHVNSPCPLAMGSFEQEIISTIRTNKGPGKPVWYDCHWSNIHTGTKPVLLTCLLSAMDCINQHP